MTSIDDAPTLAPKIFRFSDVDEFRSSVRGLDYTFTPLVRRISAKQIILRLPGCDVHVTRTFPRVVDARLVADCTGIGFAMDDHDVPIRFNGAQRDRAVVVIGESSAAYNTIEEVARVVGSIVFRPQVRDRGWPDARSHFRIFETSIPALHRLRQTVTAVMAAASEPIDPVEVPIKAAGMKESLFGAVDAAIADILPARWTKWPNDERNFRIFQQVRALLSDDLAQPIYSEEVARRLGLSVRTLHDVIRRYRGMSLHRYLRLRRLWLVRQRLLAGADSVKAVALAFGFWHLSDFSGSYRDQFGESPSETLERGRRR
jgi:AraC family ethanolamine operon transcriptional activator